MCRSAMWYAFWRLSLLHLLCTHMSITIGVYRICHFYYTHICKQTAQNLQTYNSCLKSFFFFKKGKVKLAFSLLSLSLSRLLVSFSLLIIIIMSFFMPNKGKQSAEPRVRLQSATCWLIQCFCAQMKIPVMYSKKMHTCMHIKPNLLYLFICTHIIYAEYKACTRNWQFWYCTSDLFPIIIAIMCACPYCVAL